MNDYVTKPVDPKTLAEALEKWLPRETAATTKQATGKPEETVVELLGTDLKSVPNNSKSVTARRTSP